MIKRDDISSTDKLLELIRDKDNSEPSAHHATSSDPLPSTKKTSLISSISFQKRITIGVDIGHTYIRLAKARQISEKSFELQDYLDVSLGANLATNDPKFFEHLKSALKKLCQGADKYTIWSSIPSAKVETRYIRIPKLPSKQIPNAVYWTFTKKVDFNPNEEILDYEILGDISENGIKKTEVMAFCAPRNSIESIKSAFTKIGYPLSGISIVPFAVQNLLRTGIVSPDEQHICSLFIGRDWSRIAIFDNGNLVLSRGIKAGMRSMIEAVNLAMQSERVFPGGDTAGDVILPDDAARADTALNPAAQKLFFDFVRQRHDNGTEHQENHQRVFQMMLPAMERLIRQVERTIEHYALNFNREGIRKIFISGQITANPIVARHISNHLDLPIAVMDPFPASTPFTSNIVIPKSTAKRESFVPAIGMSLSHNRRTPNFIFTHQDKEKIEAVRRINMRVLTASLVILVGLLGLFSWQEQELDNKRDQIDVLTQKLATYNPPADKPLILSFYAKVKKERIAFQAVRHRYAPLAVIGELSQLTPSNIRLLTIVADQAQQDTRKQKVRSENKSLTVEGIVFDDATNIEPVLTGYLLKLKSSELFSKPSIVSKHLEYYNQSQVLRFTARLDLT